MDLREQWASCLCLQNRPLGSKCSPAPGAVQLCVLSHHTGQQKHRSSLIFRFCCWVCSLCQIPPEASIKKEPPLGSPVTLWCAYSHSAWLSRCARGHWDLLSRTHPHAVSQVPKSPGSSPAFSLKSSHVCLLWCPQGEVGCSVLAKTRSLICTWFSREINR